MEEAKSHWQREFDIVPESKKVSIPIPSHKPWGSTVRSLVWERSPESIKLRRNLMSLNTIISKHTVSLLLRVRTETNDVLGQVDDIMTISNDFVMARTLEFMSEIMVESGGVASISQRPLVRTILGFPKRFPDRELSKIMDYEVTENVVEPAGVLSADEVIATIKDLRFGIPHCFRGFHRAPLSESLSLKFRDPDEIFPVIHWNISVKSAGGFRIRDYLETLMTQGLPSCCVLTESISYELSPSP